MCDGLEGLLREDEEAGEFNCQVATVLIRPTFDPDTPALDEQNLRAALICLVGDCEFRITPHLDPKTRLEMADVWMRRADVQAVWEAKDRAPEAGVSGALALGAVVVGAVAGWIFSKKQ